MPNAALYVGQGATLAVDRLPNGPNFESNDCKLRTLRQRNFRHARTTTHAEIPLEKRKQNNVENF